MGVLWVTSVVAKGDVGCVPQAYGIEGVCIILVCSEEVLGNLGWHCVGAIV